MSTSNTQQKHALIIGIDEYAKLAEKYQLKGCVNDAMLISGLLTENFGFPPENITCLLNEQATREGTLAAMNALVARVGGNDIVVIHYSGHGSQRRAVNLDEPSGLDSTIVTYDSGRKPDPNLDIIDDEIGAWLARLTSVTPFVTLIFDCCHSGTITRDAFGAATRWIEPDMRPIEEMGWVRAGSPLDDPDYALPPTGTRDIGPSGWVALSDGYVMLAGCRDEETSHEFATGSGDATHRNGALTHYLTQELVKAAPGTTYRDVYERVRLSVNTQFPSQHPQVEGRQDREIFGVRDIEPLRSIAVVERSGEEVTLGGGAAHGVTRGSTWRIHPQGAKQDNSADAVALIEITTPGVTTSTARIVETISEIEVGMRAVEQSHVFDDLQLAVQIVAIDTDNEGAIDTLTSLIEESSLLKHADGSGPADVRVYLLAPRESAADTDPVPELTRVTSPTWAVVDQQGLLAAPIHTIDEPEAAKIVAENLEKRTRYRNAVNLTNPAANSRLNGKVNFTLFRQGAGGEWEAAAPDGHGEVRFESDDRIAFEIENKTESAVFVSVLDFGLTDSISLIYPLNRSSYRVESGTTVRIGFQDDDRIELWVPDTFAREEGTETFKLFATATDTDFSWLQQQGTRTTGIGSNALARLFELSYSGPATRETRQEAPTQEDDWTTIERTFVLAKGGL